MAKPLNIWIIQTGEPAPVDDGNPRLMRGGILAGMLAQRGHKVTWWTGNTYHQKATQRSDKTVAIDLEKEGYRLYLLNGMAYPKKFSPRRVINHIQLYFEFLKHARKETAKPDVIFCGYPPIELAYAAARYAKTHDIPFIMDFRDQWPDIIEQALPAPIKLAGLPVLLIWKWMQRAAVRQARAVTGISTEFVAWALRSVNRTAGPLDRPFHLALNPVLPPHDAISAAQGFWDVQGIVDNASRVIGCYAGMLSTRYDLNALVDGALALTDEEKDKIRLVLCGTGDLEDTLKAKAAGQPHIILAGWRGAGELYTLMQRSDFGILPYFSYSDFTMSYPNKLGEYFSAGLPVLSCLKGVTGDLIATRDIGMAYEEGNATSAAAALRHLIANRDSFKSRKAAARETFEEMFDGAVIYPAFCDYIESMAA